jgi:D-3-phosphoglycerate dehydrogenase / 2-oxoglutarate reductase
VTAFVLKTDGVIPLEQRHIDALGQLDAQLVERPCRTAAELVEHGQEADALLVLEEPVSAAVIAQLRRCRVISRFGIGVDTIDVAAATAAGIQVTNVPDASTEEVSDHALAMLLSLARDLRAFDEAVRRGAWAAAGRNEIRRLSGRTLGLVGFGRIARRLCEKVRPLGLQVLTFDPYVSAAASADLNARSVGLAELLERSDFVSLHAPLTPETHHLLGAEEIALMRPGAFLINVSRGGLVDQAALVRALRHGTLAGAALDVMESEPPMPDDPILAAPNVLLTPHSAHYSIESFDTVRDRAIENVVRVLSGQDPLSAVNRPARSGRR